MKRNTYRTGLAAIVLTMFGAVAAPAQTEHQHGDKQASTQTSNKGQDNLDRDMAKMAMSGMMNEPHHVLAMAYMQNLGTFAKALRDSAQGSSPLSTDFARAAVEEIRRNLDEAEEHRQEHVKTIGADMRSKMAAMTKAMDIHRSRLKNAVAGIEKDVRDHTLNSKQIAADSAEVLKHLDEMSKMRSRN